MAQKLHRLQLETQHRKTVQSLTIDQSLRAECILDMKKTINTNNASLTIQ